VDFAAFDIDMRPASVENLDDFLLYLEDHLADNGAPGHTLFLPSPPGEPWPRAEKRRELANAFQVAQSRLEWIDLDVLEGNGAARDLYLSSGFVEVGRIPDLFRIQGHSVGAIQMARRIRSVGRQHESGLL
jgi:hypothetical protein